MPLLASARQFESSGEYLKAVECYLKVTPSVLAEHQNDDAAAGGGGGGSEPENTANLETCESLWVHASNLAMKFLQPESATQITELVASRLSRFQVSCCLRIP